MPEPIHDPHADRTLGGRQRLLVQQMGFGFDLGRLLIDGCRRRTARLPHAYRTLMSANARWRFNEGGIRP